MIKETIHQTQQAHHPKHTQTGSGLVTCLKQELQNMKMVPQIAIESFKDKTESGLYDEWCE
jgi:hypothetical protein